MFKKIVCFFLGHSGYAEKWFKKKDQYFMKFEHNKDESTPILNVEFCSRCRAIYWNK